LAGSPKEEKNAHTPNQPALSTYRLKTFDFQQKTHTEPSEYYRLKTFAFQQKALVAGTTFW
jgi:hypothetical protein